MSKNRRGAAGAALAAIALGLTPGSPASAAGPTATMSPSSGLHDGTVVTVRGTGFPPNANIELIECAGTVADPPKSPTSCDGFTADTTVTSDAQGNMLDAPHDINGGTRGYRIWELPSAREQGMIIRCGARNPCVLYVGANFEDFTQPKTFLSLTYAGAPSPASHKSSSNWPIVAAVIIVVAAGVFVIVRLRGGTAARRVG